MDEAIYNSYYDSQAEIKVVSLSFVFLLLVNNII